jgi:hypothetical protein
LAEANFRHRICGILAAEVFGTFSLVFAGTGAIVIDIILIKYRLEVSNEEQERSFLARSASPMEIESHGPAITFHVV